MCSIYPCFKASFVCENDGRKSDLGEENFTVECADLLIFVFKSRMSIDLISKLFLIPLILHVFSYIIAVIFKQLLSKGFGINIAFFVKRKHSVCRKNGRRI